MKKFILSLLFHSICFLFASEVSPDFTLIKNSEFQYGDSTPTISLSDYRIAPRSVSNGDFVRVMNWGIKEYREGRSGIVLEADEDDLEIDYWQNQSWTDENVLDIDNPEFFYKHFKVIDGELEVREGKEGQPVVHLSWLTALVYCNLKSRMEGFTECYSIKTKRVYYTSSHNGYRLPSEAEHNYAVLSEQIESLDGEYCWDSYLNDYKRNRFSGRNPLGPDESRDIVVVGRDGRRRAKRDAYRPGVGFRLVQSVSPLDEGRDNQLSLKLQKHRILFSPAMGITDNAVNIALFSLSYLNHPFRNFSFGGGLFFTHDTADKEGFMLNLGLRIYPFIIGNPRKFAIGCSFSMSPYVNILLEPNIQIMGGIHLFVWNFHLEVSVGQHDRSHYTINWGPGAGETVIVRVPVVYIGFGYSFGI